MLTKDVKATSAHPFKINTMKNNNKNTSTKIWLAKLVGSLVHVGRIVVRQVVVGTFDPDVLHLPTLVRIRGAAGAQLVLKEGFDLLQAPALGLRQASIDEEEAQQGHAGVEEERPCRGGRGEQGWQKGFHRLR